MSKALVIKNANFATNALDTITFNDIPCLGITLTGDTLMLVGDTQTLTATTTPANTTDAITWSSSNENAATVNGGVVTCVGNGTAVITAICGTQSATFTISCVALDLVKGKTFAPSVGYVSDPKRAIIVPNVLRVPQGATVSYQLTDTGYKVNLQVFTTENYTADTITWDTTAEGKAEFTVLFEASRSDGAAYTYDPWTECDPDDVVYFTATFFTNTSPTVNLADSDITAIKAALRININH